ncbi:SGNH/GDSL hydrolase family protein [Bacillus sp. NP157]|nr:SGNH/GDSL hydrolase family protein [Bacillus sp. NP157]
MAAASFLALGDSYTIGEGVPEQGRWPVQLVAALHAQGIPVQPPRIVATTGWTTDELSAAMDGETFQPPYALASLLIGVNDQYRGRPADGYREPFHALLQRAIALTGAARRVLVVSIPDWGVTAFAEGRDRAAIGREIDAYNAIAKDAAGREGAHWIDITGISRDTPGDVVADGLHPSAHQYTRWVERILPQAKEALPR